MKCPRCSSRLTRVSYQGVNLHCCGDCTGILIHQDRLARLAATTGKTVPDLMRDWEQKELLPPLEKSRCPECRIVMEVGRTLGGVRVDYRECRTCKLIWLDPGDLEIFQLAYLVSQKGIQSQHFRQLSQQLPEERQAVLLAKLPPVEE